MHRRTTSPAPCDASHRPWSRRARATLALSALVAAATVPLASAEPSSREAQAVAASSRGGHERVGTWSTVPTTVPTTDGTVFEDQTIRQVVRTSVGGEDVEVRLTNEFGEQSLVVGEAHVALRAPGGTGTDVVPGSDRRLTFSGRSSVTVPAGAPFVSDPADLDVPAGSDLVVSLYLPERTPATTVHQFAYQENAVADGDVTGAVSVDPTATPTVWYFLSGVSVSTRRPSAAIAALGDSITDGANTDVGTNHRWPDLLAERLRADPRRDHLGVLNEGISGNRLLHDPNPPAGSDAEGYAAYFGQSALRRFDRDVLADPGLEYVVVLLGVNDLGHPGTSAPLSEAVTAQDVIAGHRQLIARAHQHGLRIYGATITPFEGDTFGFFSPEHEAARQEVNRWIRTGGEYDAVLDFDAAVRDPEQPQRLLPRYDSGDHLHPNDAGMAALAQSVPLRLFR